MEFDCKNQRQRKKEKKDNQYYNNGIKTSSLINILYLLKICNSFNINTNVIVEL